MRTYQDEREFQRKRKRFEEEKHYTGVNGGWIKKRSAQAFDEKVDLVRSKKGNKACLEFWRGASLVTARAERPELVHRGGGKRGSAGFSGASRRRLMMTFSRVKRGCVPLFVTLTYPGEYPAEKGVWKRDLASFLKRLHRRYENSSVIWRLEFQKRGAAHFHLFIWGAPYESLMFWVAPAWYGVVGSGDERHLRAGTRVEKLRTVKGAFSYAAKYLAKGEEETHKSVGRWWGVSGRSDLPVGSLCVCSVAPGEAFDTIRLLKRFIGEKRNLPTINAFCNAEFWIQKLAFLYDLGFERVYPNEFRSLEDGYVTAYPV